jgi:hypothetical protein
LTAEKVFSHKFEVLAVVLQNIQVFWNVLCWQINSYWPFRESQDLYFSIRHELIALLSMLDPWGSGTVCPSTQCNIPEDVKLIFIFLRNFNLLTLFWLF